MRSPWLLVAITAGLLGCAAPAPVPEDRFYRLAPAEPAAPAARGAVPGTLAVTSPASDGIHRERAIVYSEEPGGRVLEQYHYHHWIAPPPDLVRDFLVSWLRGAGVAREVVAGYASDDAWVLSGRLMRFDRLVGEDGDVHVVAALDAALKAPGSFSERHLGAYRARRRAEDDSMVATVRAFEEALDGIAARLAADLEAAVAAAPGAAGGR